MLLMKLTFISDVFKVDVDSNKTSIEMIESFEFLGKKPRTKAPKIQRLVTPRVLQHKQQPIALKKQCTKKTREEAAEYAKLLAKRMKVSLR